jgi:hypothetical protein
LAVDDVAESDKYDLEREIEDVEDISIIIL